MAEKEFEEISEKCEKEVTNCVFVYFKYKPAALFFRVITEHYGWKGVLNLCYGLRVLRLL